MADVDIFLNLRYRADYIGDNPSFSCNLLVLPSIFIKILLKN